VLFSSGRSRRHFTVDKFRRALVKHVEARRNTRYDVYLVMDELHDLNSSGEAMERLGGGGSSQQEPEEIFWNSYHTAAAAEYDAVIIEGSMHRHREAPSVSNDRSSSSYAQEETNQPSEVAAPPVHASVDNVSWDELLLALSIALLCYGIAICPLLEVIVINQECGVITVERRTILSSKQQTVLPASVAPYFAGGGNVLLLAPVSLVADIESTRYVHRQGNGSTTDSWGLQICMRDSRPPLKLRCGLNVSNQRRNDEDASRLRAALRLAGFDGAGGGNNGRLDSQVNAAIGLRRVAAHQAENNEGRTEIHQNSNSAGGGGEPGGCCVVCLEKKARVAFAPCAHVCCCEDCGQIQALAACPICRSPIVHRIGLYFST